MDVMYQWQVKVFGNWASLMQENEDIEKSFCNPENGGDAVKVLCNMSWQGFIEEWCATY